MDNTKLRLMRLMNKLPISTAKKLRFLFPTILEAKLVAEWYKINPNEKFGWVKFDLFPFQIKHKIGKNSYSGMIKLGVSGHSEIYDDHYVEIGNYCSIAGDVVFLLSTGHNYKYIATSPSLFYPHEYYGDIIIGNDIWIGERVTIKGGVKIGDGAVVGTGSVVTKDVDPYTIVAGVPAKPIRRRFNDDIIEMLLKLRWWELPFEELKEIINYVGPDNLSEFIRIVDKKRLARL